MTGEIPPAIGDFPAGSQIASYRIEQLIGRGGMAVVYRASDVRLDRQVALKVLSQELGRDTAFRQRFILESRSAAAVDHPNVIPVFEAGEADGVLFIAMRYVTGQDVRALVEREGPLPAARVVNIVTQVASALDVAHAHGLIHRDVKPANILLGAIGDGRSPDHVYLSDFGLSKQSLATSSLTSTGQFLGTLDYMSPEQIEGRTIDGRTDLYALGCAAFEMLTGEPPFRRDQNLAVMWAQLSAPPPSVLRWRPELSPEVDTVIARALAKSPANRQATCRDFARELHQACAPAMPRAAAAAAPAPPGPPTELARGVATSAVLPPVSGAAVIGQQTVTEGLPASAPGTGAPSAHPGYAVTDPGAGLSGPGQAAPGATGQIYPGQIYPGQYPSGPGYPSFPPAAPAKRRGKALPVLFVLMVIAGLAGATLLVLHLRSHHNTTGPVHTPTVTITPTHSVTSNSQSPPPPPPPPPPPTTPAAVVRAYYRAVNQHDYHQAYELNVVAQQSESFSSFSQGFAGTKHVYLTVESVSGDVVSVTFTATQTNAPTKYFQGTYTVQNGQIVGANIS